MDQIELCTECFGEGRVVAKSKALEAKLVLKKCRTCRGVGTTPAIMNSAFLNDQILDNTIN